MPTSRERVKRIAITWGDIDTEASLRDCLTDARHFAAHHGLDYLAADNAAAMHFEAELQESEIHMIGVAVEYVTGDIQESGYVAHALLSDGTRSWAMGARVYPTSGPAERECLMIRWRHGGPQIERAD